MTLTGDGFTEIPVPKNMVRSMSQKLRFTGPFDRQHDKWVEAFVQSGRQHLHNIY